MHRVPVTPAGRARNRRGDTPNALVASSLGILAASARPFAQALRFIGCPVRFFLTVANWRTRTVA